MSEFGAFVAVVVFVVISFVVYFLPAIIAGRRNHPNATAITALNLILGWTLSAGSRHWFGRSWYRRQRQRWSRLKASAARVPHVVNRSAFGPICGGFATVHRRRI